MNITRKRTWQNLTPFMIQILSQMRIKKQLPQLKDIYKGPKLMSSCHCSRVRTQRILLPCNTILQISTNTIRQVKEGKDVQKGEEKFCLCRWHGHLWWNFERIDTMLLKLMRSYQDYRMQITLYKFNSLLIYQKWKRNWNFKSIETLAPSKRNT